MSKAIEKADEFKGVCENMCNYHDRRFIASVTPVWTCVCDEQDPRREFSEPCTEEDWDKCSCNVGYSPWFKLTLLLAVTTLLAALILATD